MCGIVGYVGAREAAPIILSGLRQLEYRGYDSAGLAVIEAAAAPDNAGRGAEDGAGNRLHLRREVGKLDNLVAAVAAAPVAGMVGAGHTRWATHGPPSQRNAHPHASPDDALVVVQNGIVENFVALRAELSAAGYHFQSDTDTEVIVHLIHRHYKNGCAGDLEAAVRAALAELKGPSAIVVLDRSQPDRLIAARLGNAGGVVIGIGEGETFVASDIPAILRHTRTLQFLESRQMAVITAAGARVTDLAGAPVALPQTTIEWNPMAAEKGAWRHFMQKEIFEQGRSLTDTLRSRLDMQRGTVNLESLQLDQAAMRRLERISIVACGTSYYAGLAGKHYIERLARLPVEVEYASEFRYRAPVVGAHHLALALTQSGETVDTLAALEEGRSRGATTAAIVNAVGSQAQRLCHGHILMQTGPEIGVASTKAFTASLVDQLLLALALAEARKTLGSQERAEIMQALVELPGLAGELLDEAQRTGAYAALAEEFHGYGNFMYLGRGINYAIAREGALKLKEISYIHAEGYPAGEMKHGPIALIDAQMPTVVIAPRDALFDKMVSQIEQVKARNGKVIAVGHAGDPTLATRVDRLLPIPPAHELVQPILAVLPLQIFAYEMALRRGCDVDQPRNLAKSVTVE